MNENKKVKEVEEEKEKNFKKIKEEEYEYLDYKIYDELTKLSKIPIHRLLRRRFFSSHRDLNLILESFKKGEKFYIFTGRGPSENMHIGHLIPFLIAKYFQDAFDVPVVIQITPDEKYLFRDYSLEELKKYSNENIKDILSIGFKPERTFIFSNLGSIQHFYETCLKIQKEISINEIENIFNFSKNENVGNYFIPCLQSSPSFSESYPIEIFGKKYSKNLRCLIPTGIDQDLNFKISRLVASKLGYLKPSILHSNFVPSLNGIHSKMSSSKKNSSIYLSDSIEDVEKKIKKSKSGGKNNLEQHRKFGANLEIDIAFQYLTIFLDDDDELEKIKKNYSSGKMLSNEIKMILSDVLNKFLIEHQKKKLEIDTEYILKFTTIHNIIE